MLACERSYHRSNPGASAELQNNHLHCERTANNTGVRNGCEREKWRKSYVLNAVTKLIHIQSVTLCCVYTKYNLYIRSKLKLVLNWWIKPCIKIWNHFYWSPRRTPQGSLNTSHITTPTHLFHHHCNNLHWSVAKIITNNKDSHCQPCWANNCFPAC